MYLPACIHLPACRHPKICDRVQLGYCCPGGLDGSILFRSVELPLLRCPLSTFIEIAAAAAACAGQGSWVGEAFFEKYSLANIDPNELQA